MVFLYSIALLLRSSHLQTVQKELSIDSAGQCSGKHSQILQQAELLFFALLRLAMLVYLLVGARYLNNYSTGQIVIYINILILTFFLPQLDSFSAPFCPALTSGNYFHLYRLTYQKHIKVSISLKYAKHIPAPQRITFFSPLWIYHELSSCAIFRPKCQLCTQDIP